MAVLDLVKHVALNDHIELPTNSLEPGLEITSWTYGTSEARKYLAFILQMRDAKYQVPGQRARVPSARMYTTHQDEAT